MLRFFGKSSNFWVLCQCLVLALAFGVPLSHAETKPKPDMRVLIDVSGSMKKTDPENLRIPATKLLLNLGQPGSRMGLWTFGRFVNMLVPFGTVDKAWKEKGVKEADKIGSVALFTAIGDALEQSTKGQWDKDPNWDRTIVLLSDGMVDISTNPEENAREQKRIFDQIVPRLVKGGYKVHSVALSEQADVEFLKRLANETGGHFSMASTADQLMHVFVDASDRANQPLQVPMEGGKFTIDNTVTEFTALIYRRAGSPPTVLKSPSGKRISLDNHDASTQWFSDPRFDLVTMQNPEKGAWDLEGDLDPDNRVTVVSNLDLELKGLPADAIEGEKVTLSMNLSEKGRPIVHPQFLALMDITFSQQTDRGENFEGKLSQDRNGNAVVPPDGIYVAKLGRTLTEGEHEFSVTVDGKTFKRAKRHTMTVHKEAVAASVETELSEGREKHYLALQPKVGLVKPESLTVMAEVVDPSGTKSLQEVTRTNTGELRVNVPAYNGDGLYQVFLKAQGMTVAGNPFDVTQGPYDVDYTPVGEKTQDISHKPLASEDNLHEPTLHDDLDVGDEEVEATEATTEESTKEPAEEVAEAEEPEKEAAPEKPGKGFFSMDFFSMDNMAFLLTAFVLGNLVLFGGGGFVYMRFLKRQDDAQNQLVAQLTAMKDNARPAAETPAPAAPKAAPAATTEAVAEIMAAATRESAPIDIPILDDDEATTIRDNSEDVIDEPKADRSYKIDAEPLALDEDEVVELDDDALDDALNAQLSAHAAASLEAASQRSATPAAAPTPASASPVETVQPEMDELDMILAEQEALEAQLGALDIDQPPAQTKEEKEAEEAKKKFAEDEFMLDNPTTRT